MFTNLTISKKLFFAVITLLLAVSLPMGLYLVQQPTEIYQRAQQTSYPSPSPTTCSLTGNEICVGNVCAGDCYQNSGGYACYPLSGNPGKMIDTCPNNVDTCDCTCPLTGYTWKAHENGAWWCFNTAAPICAGQPPYDVRCSQIPLSCSEFAPADCTSSPPPPPQSSPSPSPSATPGTAMCVGLKVYKVNGAISDPANWQQLTASQLPALASGEVIYITVLGTAVNSTIDRSRIRVNSSLWTAENETSSKKPGSEEFYVIYTIPAGTSDFTFEAEIHNQTADTWQ